MCYIQINTRVIKKVAVNSSTVCVHIMNIPKKFIKITDKLIKRAKIINRLSTSAIFLEYDV